VAVDIETAVEIIEALGGEVYIDEDGQLCVETSSHTGECPYCEAHKFILYHSPEDVQEAMEESGSW
jgi:hypothetical protein